MAQLRTAADLVVPRVSAVVKAKIVHKKWRYLDNLFWRRMVQDPIKTENHWLVLAPADLAKHSKNRRHQSCVFVEVNVIQWRGRSKVNNWSNACEKVHKISCLKCHGFLEYPMVRAKLDQLGQWSVLSTSLYLPWLPRRTTFQCWGFVLESGHVCYVCITVAAWTWSRVHTGWENQLGCLRAQWVTKHSIGPFVLGSASALSVANHVMLVKVVSTSCTWAT